MYSVISESVFGMCKSGLSCSLRGVRANHQIPRNSPRRKNSLAAICVSAVLALDPEFREPTAEEEFTGPRMCLRGPRAGFGIPRADRGGRERYAHECFCAVFARDMAIRREFREDGNWARIGPAAWARFMGFNRGTHSFALFIRTISHFCT